MTTWEGIVAQDADVTCTKIQMQMRKVKYSEGSDKKSGKEKKKEQKSQKNEHCSGEASGCEAEPYRKKDDEMQMQKKKKAGFDKKNYKRGPDSGKEKKNKKHKTQLDEYGSEEETVCEAEPCGKKDEVVQLQMQNKKNDPWAESINKKREKGGLDGGKEKRNKKRRTHIDELGSEEETGCKAEPCGKKGEEENKKKIKLEKSKLNEDFSQEEEKALPCSINDERKRKRSKSNDHDFEEDNVREECSHRSKDEKQRRKKTKSDKHVEEEEYCREGSCIHISKKKKRKKTKLEHGSEEKIHGGGTKCRENVEIACPERLSPKGSSKRVSFSDDVEIFPLADGQSTGKTDQGDGLIRGRRFSREEDELVKKAVLDYIKAHGLGDEGLNMVLHCKDFPEVKNCWKDIGAILPWRPYSSIYYRAHILFERDEKRKWTSEEYELVRKFHEKHGSDWKILADALGKHRFHVKDTWRRIKLPNTKKGHWSQDEYQNLFDLVNTDLRLKAFEEKKSKHGMLRDNICWGTISDKLSTRSTAVCCQKWYRQLTSPMVREGEWADVDDYRLLDALSSLDACSMEDVEWDHLLEHRDGDVCRKRWTQMVKHIGDHGNKSFGEQVEVLSKRYCLDVLGAREAYDNGPIVD